jgi:hypothetical protein
MHEFGILDNEDKLLAKFVVPLKFIDDTSIFTSDTITLGLNTKRRPYQRWRLETKLEPFSFNVQEITNHLMTYRYTKPFYIAIPQNIGNTYDVPSGEILCNAGAIDAVEVQRTAANTNKTLKKGTLFTFSNHDKVYMLTEDLKTDEFKIQFYPGLLEAIPDNTELNYLNVKMKCFYSEANTFGTEYIDGILSQHTVLALVEYLPYVYTNVLPPDDGGGGNQRTYKITANKKSVKPGENIKFDVLTTNVSDGAILIWVAQGDLVSTDITGGLSGNLTINQNTATFTLSIPSTLVLTAAKLFYVRLKETLTGNNLASSQQISLLPTNASEDPTNPIVSVVPDKTVVKENETVTFTITTQGIPNNSKLFWQIVGTATNADFDSVPSTQINVSGNTATAVFVLKQDILVEGTETFRLKIIYGEKTKESVNITITDLNSGGTNPTYSISYSTNTPIPGGLFSVYFTAANSPDQYFYWENVGTAGFNAFEINKKSDSIQILGSTNFPYNLTTNSLPGNTIKINLHKLVNGQKGELIASGPLATISTQTGLFPFTTTKTVIYPMETVGFALYLNNSFIGKTLDWKIIGTAKKETLNIAAQSDYFHNEGQGTLVLAQTTVFFTVQPNLLSIDNSTIQLEVKEALTGILLGNSPIVPIKLTKPDSYFEIYKDGVDTVKYGESFSCTIIIKNFIYGYNLYWTIETDVGSLAYFQTTQGTFQFTTLELYTTSTINTLYNNSPGVLPKTFRVALRTGSYSGPIVAQTADIILQNDFDNSSGVYTITPNKLTVDEGEVITYTITTTGSNITELIQWVNVGTTGGFLDFSSAQNNGNITVVNSTATLTIQPILDTIVEGDETVAIVLRRNTNLIAIAPTVTVKDKTTLATPTYNIGVVTTNYSGEHAEGFTSVFTITTTNVPSGSVLFWENIGNTDASDFDDGLMSGTITVSSGLAVLNRAIKADQAPEGTETIQIRFKKNNLSGDVV